MILLFIAVFFLINSSHAQDLDCVKPYSRNISLEKLTKCPKLNQFIKDNKDSSIYLVTASSFLKNPASLFGHNFLLFTKNNPSDSISGFTLNFEAVDDSKSGIEYIYKGLFGKFQGRYNLKRFYNNIKLYNNFEDRNLILNKLEFTDSEIDHFLLKAWEYSFSAPEIPYYFLNGNCAFYIYDFLENDDISHKLPFGYYSPQDTYFDLKEKLNTREIIKPSIKKEILNYSEMKEEIASLYANAQYQVYKKQRNEDAPSLKESLLKLNHYKNKTNKKLPKLNSVNFNKHRPYGDIKVGSNGRVKSLFEISAVENIYYDRFGVNKLNLLNYTTNNFNGLESEFVLAELISNQNFESKFKDLSWNMALRHQKKMSLEFESTNATLGLGISQSFLNRLYLTLKMDSIIDSRFVDIFPTSTASFTNNNLVFEGTYSQKYRLQYTKFLAGYEFYKNVAINCVFEDFKGHESRTYMALDIRL